MDVTCTTCIQQHSLPDRYPVQTVSCPACGGGLARPDSQNPAAAAVARPANPAAVDPCISALKGYFADEGFRVNDAGNTPGFPFFFSASKVRFDFVGTPTFLEEFFIVEQFAEIDTLEMKDFAERAQEWAMANENKMPKAAELSKKAIEFALKMEGKLGRAVAPHIEDMSVRETMCIVYVYALAVTPEIAPETLDWIHGKTSAAGGKQNPQPSFIVPLIYDVRSGEFHHFKKRPILGNVWYTEARKVIRKRLIES